MMTVARVVHPFTRAGLARAAEIAFRKTFPELAKHGRAAITERTIRFWTHQKLLPPRGRPNQAALYEPELLYQCVFIKRLQVEKALTIGDIRTVLTSVDQTTIKRVAQGKEPLRIRVALSAIDGSRMGQDEQVVVLRGEKEEVITANHDRQGRHDDRPLHLQQLSDSDKEDAVAAALQKCTNQAFSVEIRAVDYSGRILERGAFRSPARIECGVSADVAKGNEKNVIEQIRKVPDVTMGAAIASELASRSGENYTVELLRKRYDLERTKKAALELAFLVATRDVCNPETEGGDDQVSTKDEDSGPPELESAIAALRDMPVRRRHADDGVRCGLYAIRLNTPGVLSPVIENDTVLLYVGMSTDLSAREFDAHFHSGQTGFSTVRRSLGSILKDELRLVPHARGRGRSRSDFTNFCFDAEGEDRLTAWMRQHLSVCTWPTRQHEKLERAVIRELRPPLNLQTGNPKNQLIRSLRKACAEEAGANASVKSRGGRTKLRS